MTSVTPVGNTADQTTSQNSQINSTHTHPVNDPTENVQLACELPDVSECKYKTSTKPTEKVHTVFASTSPSMADFVELNNELDSVIVGMATGFRDLIAPQNQHKAYKIDKDRWVEAELAELNMLKERQTWDLVPAPKDKNVVGSRFMYVVKTTGDRQ